MLKKSQITVFIIIVLVILMMTGITYYIITSRTVQKGEENLARQQASAAKIDPLKEYVSSCLSLVSSEGLELLGKQGGYIYKSQGGIVQDPIPSEVGRTYADFDNSMARYGIHAPISNVGAIFFANVPDYPWPTFPEIYDPANPATIVYSEYLKGYYGMNEVPLLERPRENSIQEQLESFTVNGVIKCIDWRSFEQQGLNITSEPPNVSALFAESDVTFTLNWHLKVRDTSTDAVTDIEKFSVVYPVRMRKILDFTMLLTDADVTEISYDIQASDGLITSYRTQDIFGKDDLITIRDSESRILDRQYEFMFMRENRPPALYYIHNITGEICNNSRISVVYGNSTFLVIDDACNANSKEIPLQVLDPDEEKINITFSKQLPYTISEADAGAGEFKIRVLANDGEYEDWQEMVIKTKRG